MCADLLTKVKNGPLRKDYGDETDRQNRRVKHEEMRKTEMMIRHIYFYYFFQPDRYVYKHYWITVAACIILLNECSPLKLEKNEFD